MSGPCIVTIGYSNHSIEQFIALLEGARVTAVADVRSAPASRFAPQFNKQALEQALTEQHIAYGFLGNALGGRPKQQSLFTEGVADYEKMAASPEFRAGIARLVEAAERHRIALMCAESDPLDCHRCLLVARALVDANMEVAHILGSGEIVTHSEIEERLLTLEGQAEEELFLTTRKERLANAYRLRSRKVAYAESHEEPIHGTREAKRA
jgi:uncharacterized protein (DUF488 family)